MSDINNFTNSLELLNTLANSLHNTEGEKYHLLVTSHFGYYGYDMTDFVEKDGIVDLPIMQKTQSIMKILLSQVWMTFSSMVIGFLIIPIKTLIHLYTFSQAMIKCFITQPYFQ